MTKTCPDCQATVLSTSQPKRVGNLIDRLRSPLWVHSPVAFDSPQLEQEENLAAMNEAADALAATPAVGVEAEIARLMPYVEAFRREEARADKLATEVDELRDEIARLSAPPASPLRGRDTMERAIDAVGDVVSSRDDMGHVHFVELSAAIRAACASPPEQPALRGRESVREIAHRHCTCTCRGDPEVLQNHTNLCDEISDAILEYAAQPASPLRGREELIEQCALIAEGFDAACDSPRMKLFVDAGLVQAIYKRDGEIGAAIRSLSAAPEQPAASPVTGRELTENERHAIAHAKYQCDCSSPSDPEVRFDYEVIRTLLSLIPVPKEATCLPTS